MPLVTVHSPGQEHNDHECKLMDSFGILVQFFLGVLCFSTLVYKRIVERPQRTWQVWFMDTSKQAVGSGSAHVLNVVLATFFGKSEDQEGRACAWYMINIVLDNTLGVLVMYVTLSILEGIAFRLRCAVHLFATGSYGTPPSWARYLMQHVLWIVIVLWMKVAMTGLMFAAQNPLGRVGAAIVSLLSGQPKLQLFLVMIIVPLVTNTMQFWLVDCVVKGKVRKEKHLIRASFSADTPGFNDLLENGTVSVEGGTEGSEAEGVKAKPTRGVSVVEGTAVGTPRDPKLSPLNFLRKAGSKDRLGVVIFSHTSAMGSHGSGSPSSSRL